MLDVPNVTFENVEPTPVSVSGTAMNRKQVQALVESYQVKLPDLTRLRPVEVYNTASGTVGIGGAVLAVVLLVVTMKWWCRRWWVGQKARKPAVHPTTEEVILMETRRVDPRDAPEAAAAPASAPVPTVPKLYLPLPEMIVAPPMKSQV